MKTTPVTPDDLQRSVIAVQPLARHADLTLNPAANQAVLRHLEAGGVRSVMYGGNANFYHVQVSEYAQLLDFLAESAGPDTWVLPSAGPDYGKLMDQTAILRTRDFPTAMLLPMSFPYTDAGLADGIRRFSDAMDRPAVVYIKSSDYLAPATVARLIGEGRIAALKYAVVREDPARAILIWMHCSRKSTRAGSSAASASGRPSCTSASSGCAASPPGRSAWRRAARCACCICCTKAISRRPNRCAPPISRWRIAATGSARSACCTTP